ncbi:hypothetical protein [Nocardia cyriacigeorgica]|uniref:Uncharacterized protein n=1 Tax=Nocardia cyriacigeorgica TaxID=135487 RepID=A0A4U8VRZ8_9NOCA|nr:hypothetical protein [Nocardia cyriacigeorgica]VFA96330.1 Uncharacterised protein [Nocardia cyriacigeorgica]
MAGVDDTPDGLSPAERDQYLDRYVPDKLRAGEIPRTPFGWRETAGFWRAQHLQGKTLEKGMDVVFGLTRAGWEREVPRPVGLQGGKSIRVDFYLGRGLSPSGRVENSEAKSGTLKDRDVEQLRGYHKLLRAGEVVRLYTRAERDNEMSKQGRALLARLKKEFPNHFLHKPMNERVYQRIMEAGARTMEKEHQQELKANLAKIPQREPPSLSVERISRDYVAHVARERAEGREVGIEQLRFMHQTLREMSAAQTKAERDLAIEDRKGLGLRFHAAHDLEQAHELRLRQQHADRAKQVDALTRELISREHALLDREASHTAERIARQERDKAIDLDNARESFLGLSYSLGKIQAVEQNMHNETARELPAAQAQAFVQETESVQRERDRPVVEKIGAIGATVEREAARREHQRLLKAAREQTIVRLTPILGAKEAQARAATQWVAPPRGAEIGRDPQQILRDRDRAARERAAQAKQLEAQQIQARIERGMAPEVAELAVFHQRNRPRDPPSHTSSHEERYRAFAEREVDAARRRLIEQGISPEIAQRAAEGRRPDSPKPMPRLERTDDDTGRDRERERGLSRGL